MFIVTEYAALTKTYTIEPTQCSKTVRLGDNKISHFNLKIVFILTMFSYTSAGEDYGARMVTLRCQETKTISVE